MPDYTENYNLAKPYEIENYDVKVHNENMDKIDLGIKNVQDEFDAYKDYYAT